MENKMKPKLLFFLFVFSMIMLSAGGIALVNSSDDDITSPVGDGDITSPGGGSDDDILNPPSDGGGSDGDILNPPSDGGGSDGDILNPPSDGGGSDGDILNPPSDGGGSDDDILNPPSDGGGSDDDILNPSPLGGGSVVDCSLADADILFPASCQRVDDDGGDGGGDGGSGVSGVSNSPPVISSFSVPAAAVRNADITLTVAATDSDGGVNRIEILKDNVVIASDSCGNIFSCTKSFILRVPDAFDAVYTFVARVFDSLGAAATASGSGVTSPAPAAPPVVSAPGGPREPVSVSIPSDELFISSLVPDTNCLAPGDETFLYVNLKNTGKRSLDDVKVTAIVLDSGIRAVSGPFTIRKGDSASRFLYFMVPESAKPGDYYIRVAVTFGKDSVVKFRNFEVSSAC